MAIKDGFDRLIVTIASSVPIIFLNIMLLTGCLSNSRYLISADSLSQHLIMRYEILVLIIRITRQGHRFGISLTVRIYIRLDDQGFDTLIDSRCSKPLLTESYPLISTKHKRKDVSIAFSHFSVLR